MDTHAGSPPSQERDHVPPLDPRSRSARRAWTIGAVVVGYSAVTTQLIDMRELLTFYAGNELVLGVVLGVWLLLTGLGAWLGRHADRHGHLPALLIAGHLLLAAIPPATLVALRTGWHLLFVRGAEVGPTATVLTCFVVLLPYCVVSGYLFSAYSVVLHRGEGAHSVGAVYIADGLGSMAGGALFSLVLVHLLGHYPILVLQAGANLLVAALLAHRSRSWWGGLASFALAAVLAWTWLGIDLGTLSLQARYAGQQILFAGNSPYGSVVVTELEEQRTLFENGVPVAATQDPGYREEAIHFAMAQRPGARRVLLVSGGLGGTALEVLKYPRARVDYVELDPLILEVGMRFEPASLNDPRIEVIAGDGRRLLSRSGRRYDVIISRVPDPSTCQVNRFFTLEFFTAARDHLAPDGVFSLALGHYENYMSDELASMLATGYRTLRQVFPRVVMVPGRRVIFLASSGGLRTDIGEPLGAEGIAVEYLTPGYLLDILNPGRLADLERAVEADAPLNTDLDPVLYYLHLRYWMSHFGEGLEVPAGILAVLLGIYLFRIRAVPFAVFSAGFSASALEVVILLVFQAWYGSVYERLGMLITTFMAGMVAGAWCVQQRRRARKRGRLAGVAVALAVFATALPFLFKGIQALEAGVGWGQWALALLIFCLAALVGAQFVIAAHVSFDRVAATAARTYSADLVGACAGACLVSGLLIPLAGVTTVCLVTAGLNLVAGSVIIFRRTT